MWLKFFLSKVAATAATTFTVAMVLGNGDKAVASLSAGVAIFFFLSAIWFAGGRGEG